jgi:hypothetical protein
MTTIATGDPGSFHSNDTPSTGETSHGLLAEIICWMWWTSVTEGIPQDFAVAK